MTTTAVVAPTAPTTVGMVPLGRLRFGHDAPKGSLNIRTTDREKGLDTLQAAIRSEGFIQSVLACELPGAKKGDPLYVAAGNRRLSALFGMRAAGEIDDSYEVPAITRHGITPAEARRASLAENMERLPLHPVDRHEAFVLLRDDGASAEEIAARFAITPKQVQQDLALGSLSPKIREEWRAGKIDAGAARAFTLAQDHQHQDQLLSKLKKRGHVSDWSIHRELKVDDRQIGQLLKFVTIDAYRSAGGDISEDLFGDNHVVSNPVLLKRLADEKITAKCEKLVSEGWAWAVPRESVENRYTYGDVSKTAGKYSADAKGRGGCFVAINFDGQLHVDYGKVKPQEKRKVAAQSRAQPGAAEKKKPSAGAVSNALMSRLSEQLTLAASDAIKLDPTLALSAIIAGFSADGPVKVSEHGMVWRRRNGAYAHPAHRDKKGGFAGALELAIGTSQPAQLLQIAEIVAAAMDMQTHHATQVPLKSVAFASLCTAMKPADLNKALRTRFDAKDYFGSVNKAMCVKAIAEAVNPDEARKVAGKPKGDVTKFAVANVPKTGWLPPELRTVHYDGPGAKVASAAAAKGKAPKKRARA